MSHCVETKHGSLFDPESQGPPYTAEVERVCSDAAPDGTFASRSRHYRSFMSNTKPDNPERITQQMQTDIQSNESSILGNIAHVIRNVLVPQPQRAIEPRINDDWINQRMIEPPQSFDRSLIHPTQQEQPPLPRMNEFTSDNMRPQKSRSRGKGGSSQTLKRKRSEHLRKSAAYRRNSRNKRSKKK
jgi:hypothetical protein